jgi:amphi-Trp domain-containing protein
MRVPFLFGLSEKLATGNVILHQRNDELQLNLPKSLIFEVQVEDEDKGSKGMQHSLEVEIKWFYSDHGSRPMQLG